MMAEFRRIQMSLFLVTLLQFTAAGQLSRSLTFRVGDDVTLSCENVIDDQNNCDSTTWLFSESRRTPAVTLVDLGKIVKNAKSDRLSVTANCSLVIKKVTHEDVGRCTCREFRSGRQVSDSQVDLSVVTMTEHKDTDEVTLTCSVRTYDRCKSEAHTVKWLFQGQDVDKDNKEIKTSQSLCSASVSFLTYLYIYTSRYKLFTCAVTDGDRVQVFPFRSQSSGEDTTTATTTAATASTTPENNTTADSWVYIIVAVALAALLILIVAIIVWRRTKGNKTQMSDAIADPEDGVSYASISYTKKTNSKAQVLFKDEDDAVTYSTVKASSSSSSAGASADLTNLYATINKPNK